VGKIGGEEGREVLIIIYEYVGAIQTLVACLLMKEVLPVNSQELVSSLYNCEH
jgi:hypothetical protein